MRLPTSDREPRLVATSRGPVACVDEPAEGPAGEPGHSAAKGGPPLLLIHGVPGSVRDFRYLAPQLAGVRRVRLDLPGYGATPAPPGWNPSLEERARVVLALADALGLERFALLGHSMGGGVALALAALAPTRVTHLFLLSSVGPVRHRGLRYLYPPLLHAVRGALRLPWIGPRLVVRLRRGLQAARFPNTDRMGVPELDLIFRQAASVRFGAVRRWARGVRVPTLVAWTEDDHLVEPRVSRALHAAIPGAQALSWPDGGHNPQKAHAVALGGVIRRALSGDATMP